MRLNNMGLKNTIQSDLYRYDKETSLLKGLFIPGFRFTFFFRKSSASKNPFLGLFYRLITRRLKIKYGFQIPVGTEIGRGLFMGHFGSIVINKKAKIGDNCNIAHTITIGQANRGNTKGCPVIGNNVWIGTGSVIVGKIIIGDNVLIAPNTFVNGDVPSNSLVIGNPFKIIPKKNPTEGYINNIKSD
ncbi:serine acetyltransferase [Zobellia roscoffensis]|uniref:serine O-acetyltransferase n=1 Tax=Zobellia roscoffensis TaxID=2779508 RepID=UPI00188B49EC|nr:serine acetyltransferase [Zobellia roscoffensis]